MRRFPVLLLLGGAFLVSGARLEAEERLFKDCYARWDGARLLLGNRMIERAWRLDGGLRAASFRDPVSGAEFLEEPEEVSAGAESSRIQAAEWRTAAGVTGLQVSLAAEDGRTVHFAVIPETPAILSWIEAEGEPEAQLTEQFQFGRPHRELGAVRLAADTRSSDNLVQLQRFLLTVPGEGRTSATLFFLEDPLEQAGVVLLGEAPAGAPEVAAQWRGAELSLRISGGNASTRLTSLVYQGGAVGRSQALARYQRALATGEWAGPLVWHEPGRQSAEGPLDDLYRAKDLGLGHVTAPDAGPAREPILAKAAELGLVRGLRVPAPLVAAPEAWKQFGGLLAELGGKYGPATLQVGGLTRSQASQWPLFLAGFHAARGRAGRDVLLSFDLDGPEGPGYWGLPGQGLLRLAPRDSTRHAYYPHAVLRNLWQLAHFVDIGRIVAGFHPPDAPEADYYGDPLAPARFGLEYLFATVMFARPALWSPPTALGEDSATRLARAVAVYQEHRKEILEGFLLPAGSEPTGQAWTGFQSQAPGRDSGYLLAFRELNVYNSAEFQLSGVAEGFYRFECVMGDCKDMRAYLDSEARVKVELPEMRSFALYRYEPVTAE